MKLATLVEKTVLSHTKSGWRPAGVGMVLALVMSSYLSTVIAEEAAPNPPTQVVQTLIQAAKANDLDKVLYRMDFSNVAIGMHGRSGTNAVALLRGIDLSSFELVGRSTPSTPTPVHEHVIVRTPDAVMRFELKLRDKETVIGAKPYEHSNRPVTPHYVVTEIHPHP